MPKIGLKIIEIDTVVAVTNTYMLQIVVHCHCGCVGYLPRTGWAADPFGHSATMAYLLRRSGITSMLIQRAHYAVKKRLAYQQQLQFMWHQAWGTFILATDG